MENFPSASQPLQNPIATNPKGMATQRV